MRCSPVATGGARCEDDTTDTRGRYYQSRLPAVRRRPGDQDPDALYGDRKSVV